MRRSILLALLFCLLVWIGFLLMLGDDPAPELLPNAVRVDVESGKVSVEDGEGVRTVGSGEGVVVRNDGTVDAVFPTPTVITGHEIAAALDDIPSVTVSGLVVDEEGNAFGSAIVEIVPADNERSESSCAVDRLGRYATVLPTGDFVFRATASEALAAVQRKYRIASNPFPPVDFVLPRARRIAGAVLNQASEPVGGATIQIYARRLEEGVTVEPSLESGAELQYETVSERDGSFVLEGIWPGAYCAVVRSDGYLPHREQRLSTRQTHKTIVLKQEAELRVTVTDSQKKPLMMAKVDLKHTGGEGLIAQTEETGQKGTCSFQGLLPGTYRISATHWNCTPSPESVTTVEIVCDEESCALQLQQNGFSISGRIMDAETGAPVPHFVLCLSFTQFESEILGQTRSDGEGNFRFENVVPGTYKIFEPHAGAGNEDSEYAVQGGMLEKTEATLVDKDVEGVEVAAFRKAEITGHVYSADGEPISGAELFCGHLEFSQADGSYRFYSPPLGFVKREGRVQAEEIKQKVTASHPDFGEGESEVLRYRPGDKIENVDITLGGLGNLSGIVVNTKGEPVSGANVTFRKSKRYQKTTTSGADGQFEFNGVGLHDSFLEVEAEGYVRESTYLNYPCDAKRREERIELLRDEEGTAITGVVVDKNGEPVSDATITMMPSSKRFRGEWRSYFEFQISGFTGSDGRFRLETNDANETYVIRFRMSGDPYLTEDVYNFRAGSRDLVVRLSFQPVDVKVSVDDSALSEGQKKPPYTLRAVSKRDASTPMFPLSIQAGETKSFYLSEPGDYDFIAEGETYEGRTSLSISEKSEKVMHVAVSLQPLGERIVVEGRLSGFTPETSSRPTRIRIRPLDPSVAYLDEVVYCKPAAEGSFALMVPEEGDYAVEYFDQSGVLFHREFVSVYWENVDAETGRVLLPEVSVEGGVK